MGENEKYDIPDLNRIERLMNIWSPVRMHAYITDLYEGLRVRDREIEELKKSDKVGDEQTLGFLLKVGKYLLKAQEGMMGKEALEVFKDKVVEEMRKTQKGECD